MSSRRSLDTERAALSLFEQLLDAPEDERFRADLIKDQPQTVVDRLRALEASAVRAQGSMPTQIPGAAANLESRPPPAQTGAFRLVTMIGQGGMGQVWLGQRSDGLYEQSVAIKLIQQDATGRAARAFDDERRFLAKLEHPNIARLIDGGLAEGDVPWLAMELVDGKPIDSACAGLPTAERVRLFVKAVDAVQYAHGRLVAHGDLKPGNIFVTADGRVKLLDFGIAGLVGAGHEVLAPGPVTREFASPERLASGGPSVADDIFALGKTLAMVLDGIEDRELAAIAGKASAAEQADRYTGAAELIADLERWQAKLPVSAIPSGWRYATSKFLERHMALTIATGAVIVLLSATSITASLNFARAERERGVAEQRFGAVRHLSSYMLFDVYDDLARQPGTVARRVAIATTASDYLQRLSVSSDAPADLRLETARSYRRLAGIQGLAGTPNIGQPAQAARSLDHAEQILRGLIADSPTNPGAPVELGWVLADRWTLLGDETGSGRTNLAARQAFDAALAQDPSNAEALLGDLTTEKNQAYDLLWTADKPLQAQPVARAALERLRGTTWPPSLRPMTARLEISLLNRMGDAVFYGGDVARSLAWYRQSDAVVDRLIAAEGATPELLTLKAEAAFNLSGTIGELGGRDNEALAIAEQGAKPIVQLLKAGPDAAAEKVLLMLYGQQAAVLEGMGRAEAALIPSAASIELRRRRAGVAPGDPRRAHDVAIGLTQHATLLAKAGRKEQACAAAGDAVAAWRALQSVGQLGVFEARNNVPKSEQLRAANCGG